MKTAFFECHSGISGDMILGALLDVGLDVDVLAAELRKVDLAGYRLLSSRVNRSGIWGTGVDVKVDSDAIGQGGHRRGLGGICRLIDKSTLADGIKESSIAVFERLASAEARVHNARVEDVHFHEVGAVDSIVDVVGSVIGFHHMGFDRILFSPIAIGSGCVECEHGRLPLPAPATAELLTGCEVVGTDIKRELTTPTGAAIITTLGEQAASFPAFRLSNVGYGAGSSDGHERPNLLRVFVGDESDEETGNGRLSDEVWMVEANIDDMHGEVSGYIFDKLLGAGAVDVFMTPVQMKKCRPAVLISAIVTEAALPRVESVFFDQSTTFGVRRYKVRRTKLVSETVDVGTLYGRVRVKIGTLDGGVKSIAPEYDDCKRIADTEGVPLKLVYNEVMKAAGGGVSR